MKFTKEQIKENRKKWIAALRSGKYKKGMGFLHTKEKEQEKFCCLGVACDLFNKEYPNVLKVEYLGKSFKYDDTNLNLPEKVRQSLGLENRDICIRSENNSVYKKMKKRNITSVSVLNDSAECSFNKIADILEEELL